MGLSIKAMMNDGASLDTQWKRGAEEDRTAVTCASPQRTDGAV